MKSEESRTDLLKGLRAALALALIPVAAAVSLTSSAWIGRTFPGFFLMANRVVPSVGLSHWSGVRDGNFYQAAVINVDGYPVNDSREAYALVQRKAPGTSIRYTLAKEGRLYDRSVPAMRFSGSDYTAIFIAYLLNGAAYAVIAICAALGPATAVSCALLSLGLSAGLFALTGADLYYPHHFFRLHALAEAFFPASLVHLALVFPRNWLRGNGTLAVIPYLVSLPLAAAYEMVLYDPAAYSAVHNASTVCLGLGGSVLLAASAYGYCTEREPLRKEAVGLVALGALAGLGLPAVLMTVSGISGGSVPVNLSALTAPLFPVSLAWAAIRYKIALPSIDLLSFSGASEPAGQ